MKKIILIGLIALMAMSVLAYNEGDLITQSEFDAINFDTVSITQSWYGINSGFYKESNRDMISRYNYVYQFKKHNSTHFKYIKRSNSIKTDTYSFYTLCTNNFGLYDCYKYFFILSEKNRYNYMETLRSRMKRMQTPEDEPEIIMG